MLYRHSQSIIPYGNVATASTLLCTINNYNINRTSSETFSCIVCSSFILLERETNIRGQYTYYNEKIQLHGTDTHEQYVLQLAQDTRKREWEKPSNPQLQNHTGNVQNKKTKKLSAFQISIFVIIVRPPRIAIRSTLASCQLISFFQILIFQLYSSRAGEQLQTQSSTILLQRATSSYYQLQHRLLQVVPCTCACTVAPF